MTTLQQLLANVTACLHCLMRKERSAACERDRYFLNAKCWWYAQTFEGIFEVCLTGILIFSVLVRHLLIYRIEKDPHDEHGPMS
jgi:hypothetical protein